MGQGDWYLKKCDSAAAEEEAKVKVKAKSKRRKILLRATHVLRTTNDDSPLVCTPTYSEFHILDLDTGILSKTPFTLLDGPGVGTMLLSESKSESESVLVYTLGKRPDGFREYKGCIPPDYSDYYARIKAEDDIVVHHDTGLSCFNLANPQLGWTKGPGPSPLLKEDQYHPNSVHLCGKLYTLLTSSGGGGSSSSSSSGGFSGFGEVYDPKLNAWQPLTSPAPPLPGEYKVSTPLVVDPLHGRILVHFEDLSRLPVACPRPIYAYYPAQARWDCLVDHFEEAWEGPLAYVDGVIYFFIRKCRELLWAYDLHTKLWLEVVLTSQFDKDYSRSNFGALHHLGNGFMCLTTYFHNLRNKDPSTIVNNHTVFLAVQFKIKRVHRSGGQVLVTPLSSLSCPMPSCCQINGQIAI